MRSRQSGNDAEISMTIMELIYSAQMKRRLSKGLCFGVLGLSLILEGCGGSKVQTAAVPTAEVGTNTIAFTKSAPQLGNLKVEAASTAQTASIHLTGRLTWDDEVTVRVFSPIGGRVADSPTIPGQPVKPGDLLCRISSSDFGQAQADERKAKADLILAERTLTRTQSLLAHGAAAQKDVDAAEDAFHNAKAEQERALARMALYGGTGDVVDQLFKLSAPLGGILVEKNLNPGQEVRPDQMLANSPNLFAPLFVISDPTRLWLYLDVVENNIAGLHAGQKLNFESRAYPGKSFEGELDWIGDGLDPATRSVRVRARVKNPDRLLKAEMYVDATLTLDNSTAGNGVDLPTNSVFYDFRDRKSYVFVETEPGHFIRRAVKVARENGPTVLVSEGVKPGERVVTSGCLLLDSMLQQNRAS